MYTLELNTYTLCESYLLYVNHLPTHVCKKNFFPLSIVLLHVTEDDSRRCYLVVVIVPLVVMVEKCTIVGVPFTLRSYVPCCVGISRGSGLLSYPNPSSGTPSFTLPIQIYIRRYLFLQPVIPFLLLFNYLLVLFFFFR